MARIDGDDGNNNIKGTDEDDTINGLGGNDTIRGGDGDDLIDAGTGFDKVFGGDGDDTILGGGDNDELRGGDDADRFVITSLIDLQVRNTTVYGGSGGRDNDILDLSRLLAEGWEITNLVQNPENNGNPGFNGQVQLFNPLTGQFANINFFDIEGIVICFTPGTRIATRKGEVCVEHLRPGDDILTRDNGVQPLRSIGRRQVSAPELACRPEWQPVLIREGALGPNQPERDMLISPNHRMLLRDEEAALLFEEREVLVAAKHLTDLPGVDRVKAAQGIEYIHLMFDQHEVVLADGAWSESFQPGQQSLGSICGDQRAELQALFPELETDVLASDSFPAARRALKGFEARLLTRREAG